ncbi:hypothetical protein I8935_00545 [Campylobacter coli]|uniref:Uncharacterized protein n=1 Tax=Campylobacter coli TaxID=195 RepID=A0A3Z9GLP7_CAMCO|nr:MULTISPECIES: hypothetical protein [Campylobacter]AHK77701.1 hypothetical protein YSS_09470 [Campylobacter coli RM4661]EAC1220528.1 hypothetical protein [Campylobacter coli]EAC1596471.1 hypothetical protein [Campylobacter coli]EAH4670174.1 hypothetical protein [Campylobacter coli]EAH5017169.1 hypothetical protein [Campylobacter coli]
MKKSVKILLSVATFAYDPYACSLQNLINPDSCNPNLVPNGEYACQALLNVRVNGEPVCVEYY